MQIFSLSSRHAMVAVSSLLVLASACLNKEEQSSAGVPDAAVPIAAGGTGAFGIITVDGKQKMYLPVAVPNRDGHGIIAVVDVGVPGNGIAGAPALITEIDLGESFMMATTTGGDSNV